MELLTCLTATTSNGILATMAESVLTSLDWENAEGKTLYSNDTIWCCFTLTNGKVVFFEGQFWQAKPAVVKASVLVGLMPDRFLFSHVTEDLAVKLVQDLAQVQVQAGDEGNFQPTYGLEPLDRQGR